MAPSSKHRFERQESWRLKRVKVNWRRPRGVTSRMRKEDKGWPIKVKVGYGNRASERGLHPRGLRERLVRTESDLEGLDPKVHLVRLSGKLGERRRLVLLDRVKALNVHIVNPGKEEARPPEGETGTGESKAETLGEGSVTAGKTKEDEKGLESSSVKEGVKSEGPEEHQV